MTDIAQFGKHLDSQRENAEIGRKSCADREIFPKSYALPLPILFWMQAFLHAH